MMVGVQRGQSSPASCSGTCVQLARRIELPEGEALLSIGRNTWLASRVTQRANFLIAL
jgi:hypothetical protein